LLRKVGQQTMTGTIDSRIHTARAALRSRQPLVAIAQLNGLLAQHPDNVDAAELLGVAHSQAGNRQKALDALQRATEIDPGRATAHYNYALILAEDKNTLDDAVMEVQAALLINRDYPQALALQEKLTQRIRERAWRSDEEFAVVDAGNLDPRKNPQRAFAKLQCPYCNGMNFSTARVCVKCGNLIPEMEEIVPVE